MNEIAAVELKTTLPLFFDPYREESHHGQLHRHRPAHQRHRCRRNHREAAIAAPVAARTAASATHRAAARRKSVSSASGILRGGMAAGAPARRRNGRAPDVRRRLARAAGGAQRFSLARTGHRRESLRTLRRNCRFRAARRRHEPESGRPRDFRPGSVLRAAQNHGRATKRPSTQIMEALRKWRDTQSDPTESANDEPCQLRCRGIRNAFR